MGKNATFCVNIYIRCEMTPTSVGGEQQISISGGVNLPSDIASGRAHIVRWTMVLRRPKRSVDLQRCAEEVCHALHDAHLAARMPGHS
ncbi:hypothetical protein FYJ25_10865 [Anaerobutyricum soehngenii]|uniref:Uncharacterized protein n=1 Tax=Anaerobutyricum soehngenii TaxID=105843 RepID=A0A6N7YCQ5_9FIRM|nr:hypothetical protein [Anaerobutyricum soehngenii]